MNVSRTRSYDNFKDTRDIPGLSSYEDKDNSNNNDLFLLQQKLQYVKNDRKAKENNAKALQHRVNLLLSQEKQAVQKFETTKQKFEKIIQIRNLNKSKSREKDVTKLEKRGYNTSGMTSQNITKNSFNKSNKLKNNSNQNLPSQISEKIEKIEDKSKNELIEKREKLKEILLRKLMEEERERLQLENMLANIEKEEITIIKNCRLNCENEIIPKNQEGYYDNSSNYKSEKRYPKKYI